MKSRCEPSADSQLRLKRFHKNTGAPPFSRVQKGQRATVPFMRSLSPDSVSFRVEFDLPVPTVHCDILSSSGVFFSCPDSPKLSRLITPAVKGETRKFVQICSHEMAVIQNGVMVRHVL